MNTIFRITKKLIFSASILALIGFTANSLAATTYTIVVPISSGPTVVAPYTLGTGIPPAYANEAYSDNITNQLQASDGSTINPILASWSLDPATPMPKGLTLASDGTISGTPTNIGLTQLNLTLTYNG